MQWRVCLPCFGCHLSAECAFYSEAVLDTALGTKAVVHPANAAVAVAFAVPVAVAAVVADAVIAVVVVVAVAVVVAAAAVAGVEAAAEFQVVLVSELDYFFAVLAVEVWMWLLILESEDLMSGWVDLTLHGECLDAAML